MGILKKAYLEKELKKQDTDPHQLKKDFLGDKAPISEYDIYRDKNSGQLAIFKKSSGKLAIITDVFI